MEASELLTQCVERGAALLTQHDPDWYDVIDLPRVGRIRMESAVSCVVACWHGFSYWEGIKVLGVKRGDVRGPSEAEVEHGFCLPCGASISDYDLLSRIWTDKIIELRNGAASRTDIKPGQSWRTSSTGYWHLVTIERVVDDERVDVRFEDGFVGTILRSELRGKALSQEEDDDASS